MITVKNNRFHVYGTSKYNNEVWNYGRTYFYCQNCGVEHIRGMIEPETAITCPAFDAPMKYDKGLYRCVSFEGVSKNIPGKYDYIKDVQKFHLSKLADAKKELANSDMHFKEMYDIRIRNRIELLASSIDGQHKVTIEAIDTDKIKTDKKMLIDYIKKMISVENVVFSLSKRLEKLYSEKAKVKANYSEQILCLKMDFEYPKTTLKLEDIKEDK